MNSIIQSLTVQEIAAVAVSLSAAVVLAWVMKRNSPSKYIGPKADMWEPLRSLLMPLNRVVKNTLGKGYYTSYTLSYEEYVGCIDKPPEEVEPILYKSGFDRMPLAAYKTLPDGVEESSSWAKRRHIMAKYQTHVMLFRSEVGSTLVFAHKEFNAANPFYAYAHYRGKYYDEAEGQNEVVKTLPPDIWVDSLNEFSGPDSNS